jgi:glycosyltransferase involved in cell wall biosynthesis
MSIHFPNGPYKQWSSRQGAIAKLFGMLYSFQQIKSNNYVVTNSKFSRLYFQRYYPAYRQSIPVIYPPVRKPNNLISPFNERANIVCSIGRFCQEKNQLAQISLAERLPDWKFKLIGFADEKNTYLNDCESYVNEKGIKNVEFELNVPLTRKRELLQLAKFFIHPNINEPFGISTAESILNGCLPLVHNSGGQIEIVPIKELRFNAIDEIGELLGSFKGSDKNYSAMQKDLYHHCRTCFNADVFKKSIRGCIEHFESNYCIEIQNGTNQ